MKKFFGLALAVGGILAGVAAYAANGTWTNINAANQNQQGVAVNVISTTTMLMTPPLPLKWPRSTVLVGIQPVTATTTSASVWATLAPSIGQSQTVTYASATVVGVTNLTTSSMTQLTTSNLFHDVGMLISPTAGGLVNVRVMEVRPDYGVTFGAP